MSINRYNLGKKKEKINNSRLENPLGKFTVNQWSCYIVFSVEFDHSNTAVTLRFCLRINQLIMSYEAFTIFPFWKLFF